MELKSLCNISTFCFSVAVIATAAGSSGAYAQNSSALVTSGMGGGATSTARLTAQVTQLRNWFDDIEACGNKARFYGPSFGGTKDGDSCLTDITLTSDGNFGIGTASPDQKLHVNGSALIGDLLLGDAAVTPGIAGLAHNGLANKTTGFALAQISSGKTMLNAAPGQDIQFTIGGSHVKFRISDDEIRSYENFDVGGTLRTLSTLTIQSGGAAITGNVAVSNDLTVGGDATADNYYHTSDRRLKDDIRRLDDGESIVARLKPVRFIWKKGDKPSMGFIAQEVEKVLPEAVITNGDGYKAMDYNMLIAPLVATLQAQQSQIAAQQRKLDFQQEQIRKLITTVTEEFPSKGR